MATFSTSPTAADTSDSTWLSLVSRRKLQSPAVSGDRVRDNRSLRRFVLLKNSITGAPAVPHTPLPVCTEEPEDSESHEDDQEDEVEEEDEDDEEDVFVFPDVYSFAPVQDQSQLIQAGDEEARWLDSLLEDLEDDEPDSEDMDVTTVSVAIDDDDDDDYDSYLDESDLSSLFDGPSSSASSDSLSLSTSSTSPPSNISPPSSSPPEAAPFPAPQSPQFYPLPDDPDNFDLDSEPPELLRRSAEEDEDSEADSLDWPLLLTPSFGRSTSSLSLSLSAGQQHHDAQPGAEQREERDSDVDFVEELSYFHPFDFDHLHHHLQSPAAVGRYRGAVC